MFLAPPRRSHSTCPTLESVGVRSGLAQHISPDWLAQTCWSFSWTRSWASSSPKRGDSLKAWAKDSTPAQGRKMSVTLCSHKQAGYSLLHVCANRVITFKSEGLGLISLLGLLIKNAMVANKIKLMSVINMIFKKKKEITLTIKYFFTTLYCSSSYCITQFTKW